MSTIGPDSSHLAIASGLHRIDGPLDDLRRQQGGEAHEVQGTAPAADTEAAPLARADAGEQVLGAPAWDGAGSRLLAGDLGLEARLGGMGLAQAAESAVDSVLEAFA